MVVIKVVDFDVAHKVDTDYISEHFASLQNVGILYMCTSEGGEEEDWIDASGVRNLIIQLPYNMVKRMENIRPLMLMKAKERLGLVA